MFENVKEAGKGKSSRVAMVLAGLGAVAILVSAAIALRRGITPPVSDTPTAAPTGVAQRPPIVSGTMVRIPGGTFRMGSEGGDRDETPIRERNVAPFELDMLEVTVAEFEACVGANQCAPAVRAEGDCNAGKPERRDHPINCVDHQQAAAYCRYMGKRLPSEIEWEIAARGTAGRTYPWGEDPPTTQLCWNGDGSELGKGQQRTTCVVGTHPKGSTPDGVQDLAGNVWEWTASSYCPYDDENCTTELRVLRGGGFNNSAPGYVRGADRAKDRAATRNNNLGFRCARDLPR